MQERLDSKTVALWPTLASHAADHLIGEIAGLLVHSSGEAPAPSYHKRLLSLLVRLRLRAAFFLGIIGVLLSGLEDSIVDALR